MSILPLSSAPAGGWTKEELKLKMDELLDKMITASDYGEKTLIEEEDSKLEVANLQATLKDSWIFLKSMYDSMPDNNSTVENITPTRMRSRLRLDFQT